MNTMKAFVLAGTALLILNSCIWSGESVSGNREVTREEREVESFEELTVAGSMQVYLTQGAEKAAVIEAESNLIPYIILQKKGDELKVKFKSNINIKSHAPIRIYLAAPRVNDLEMIGSGKIKVENRLTNKESIGLKTTGSGDIHLQVNTPKVDAKITGSGDIYISGETRKSEIEILGSGDFKGKGLKSEQTKVKIAGSGDARVYSSISLDAKVFGSGDVYYSGNPQIKSNIAGSGEL